MLLNAVERYVAEQFGKAVTVTSVYRPPKLNATVQSVHTTTPCRGIDIRVNGLWSMKLGEVTPGAYEVPKTLSIDEAEQVVAWLNRRYLYDTTRPQKVCAIFGELDTANGHWDHIHLQGHPRTRLVVSQQPDVLDDDDNAVAEDFVTEAPLAHGAGPGSAEALWARLAGNDVLVGVARRLGKGASAVATCYLMQRLGVGPELSAASIPTYLALEKGLNKAVEDKTGKSTNLDWATLLYRLLALVVNIIRKKGGAENASK
jgi:hypothetical protein